MAIIRKLADQYRYVTVDCKFPGIVARPIGSFHSTSEYHYQTLRTNVDILRVVQVGITLTDNVGQTPPGFSGTWQFNFKFDASQDMGSADGLEVLRQSGLEFHKHEVEGIDHLQFAELLTSSGLVLNDQMTWISFHSGYDLGYLLSMMANNLLPAEKQNYMQLFNLYFPSVWDVKSLIKAFKLSDKNYLHEVGLEFGLFRGSGFTLAGVDSCLTALCFFYTMRAVGESNMHPVKNVLFGLGDEPKEEDEPGVFSFNSPARLMPGMRVMT